MKGLIICVVSILLSVGHGVNLFPNIDSNFSLVMRAQHISDFREFDLVTIGRRQHSAILSCKHDMQIKERKVFNKSEFIVDVCDKRCSAGYALRSTLFETKEEPYYLAITISYFYTLSDDLQMLHIKVGFFLNGVTYGSKEYGSSCLGFLPKAWILHHKNVHNDTPMVYIHYDTEHFVTEVKLYNKTLTVEEIELVSKDSNGDLSNATVKLDGTY